MCLFSTPDVKVEPTTNVAAPAPAPPTPPAPETPDPLAPAEPLTIDEAATEPKIQYGRKKNDELLARSSGANALRIPLNTGSSGGSSGGLNV